MIAALLLAAALAQPPAPAESDDPIGDLIGATTPAGEALDAPAPRPAILGALSDMCLGDFIEGGTLFCRAPVAGVRLSLGEVEAVTDEAGLAILALPRSTPERVEGRIEWDDRYELTRDYRIIQRDYDLQRVDGVPQSTVRPDPSTLERRQREYAQKQAAFNSVWDGRGFLDGFIPPAQGRTTGVYGSARIYNNGEERGVHWGLDWAAPTGTPVYAPASGRIALAESDMYYEGGLIFLDHGQGLTSAFLHLSAVHVEEGQIVQQGELIGEIGAGGRSTGPHLDWRVKLRNQFYVDPQYLLDLDLSPLQAD